MSELVLPGDESRYQMRPCGPCTACCRFMAVPEIEKPEGVWCQHCSKGEGSESPGCRIYAKRPQACRSFTCLWSHGLTQLLTDEDRPDKIKVFLYSFTDRHGEPAVGFCELVPDTLNRPRVRDLVDELVNVGFTVRFRHHDGQVNWIEGGGRWKRYLTVSAIDLPGVADDGRVIDPKAK